MPTWNYVMVQARGLAAGDRGRRLARPADRGPDPVAQSPRASGRGRSPTRRPISLRSRRRAIVGVEIEILDIRGKWKASQNRNAADRTGVVAGLEALRDDPEAQAMAAIVRDAKRD